MRMADVLETPGQFPSRLPLLYGHPRLTGTVPHFLLGLPLLKFVTLTRRVSWCKVEESLYQETE